MFSLIFALMSATVPPNIKGEEANATVMLGHQVELQCHSDAIPPPTLTWRKDGRPLFRKPGLTVSADGSILRVRQVTGPIHSVKDEYVVELSMSWYALGFSPQQVKNAQVQDSGRYSCQATNVAGKTEKNYNLNVWGEWTLIWIQYLN